MQTGAEADIEKYSKRTVRVTAQHNEECRRLLRLMGVPVIEVMDIGKQGKDNMRETLEICKDLLQYFCIPHRNIRGEAQVLSVAVAAQAPSEAEAQCAQMCKEGLVRKCIPHARMYLLVWLLHKGLFWLTEACSQKTGTARWVRLVCWHLQVTFGHASAGVWHCLRGHGLPDLCHAQAHPEPDEAADAERAHQ